MGPVAGTPILPGAPGLPAVMLADSTRYFDDINRIVEETVEGGTSPGGETVTTYWNVGDPGVGYAAGRVKSVRRKLNATDWSVTTYDEYNAAGGVLQRTDPAGVHNWEFDAQGNRVNYNDPRGYETVSEYDFNRLIKVTDPEGHFVTYAYDVRGNRTGETRRQKPDADNPAGKVLSDTAWDFDEAGRLIRTTRKADTGDQVTETLYDPNGNPRVETLVASGAVTETAYDGLDRAVRVRRKVDAANWEGTEYEYDTVRLNKVLPLGGGAVTHNLFDALHRATTVAMERPEDGTAITKTVTAFDGLDRAANVSVQEADGTKVSETRNTYDLRGQRTRELRLADPAAGPQAGKDRFLDTAYDAGGRVVSSTDPAGTTTTEYGAASGNVELPWKVNVPASGTTVTTYGPGALPIDSTHPATGRTVFTFDGNGRRTATVSSTGEARLTAYDGEGRAVLQRLLKGATTYEQSFTEFDALGGVTKTVRLGDPLSPASAEFASYDRDTATGRLHGVSDANGTTSFRDFDLLNRPGRTVDPTLNETRVQRDGRGNVVRTRRFRSDGTQFADESLSLDALDRTLVRIRGYAKADGSVSGDDAENAVSILSYDAGSRVKENYDPEGKLALTKYDGLDQTAEVAEDALGINRKTRLGYDAAGRMTARTDDAGNTTTYGYDAAGWVLTVNYQIGAGQSPTYDGGGRLLTETNARGWVTSYSYDGAGRVTDRQTVTPGPNPRTFRDRFEYTAGRLTLAERWVDGLRVARNALVKDGLDRTLADAQTVRDQPERIVTSTYDLAGDRVAVGYPDGRKIGYVPAPDRRVAAVAEGFSTNADGDLIFGPLLAEYAYDGPDRVKSRTYRPGTAGGNPIINLTRWGYDGARNVKSITSTRSGPGFTEVVFAIDQRIGKGGGKTYEARFHAPERSLAFTEDSLYRLTGFKEGLPDPEQLSVIPAPTRAVSYSLDRMGNIGSVASAGGGLPQPGETRTHNALHQLTDIASPSELLSAHFEYDADGNLCRETRPGWPNTVWTYEYDERNRLCRIVVLSGDDFNGDRVEIIQDYDALGKRTRWTVEEVWTEEGNAYILAQDEVVFLHDGQRVIEERDGAGVVLRQYVWGPQFVDELLVQDTFTGGTFAPALRRYALQDAVWSVTTLLRPDGSVEQQRFFDPYGKYTYELFPAPGQPNFYWGVYCPYRWQGKHQDDWTGLLHSRKRTYRPDIQRWLQRDPKSYRGSPHSNLYLALAGNPVLFVDPFGEEHKISDGVAFNVRLKLEYALLANKTGRKPSDPRNAEVISEAAYVLYHLGWDGEADLAADLPDTTTKWYEQILDLLEQLNDETDGAWEGEPIVNFYSGNEGRPALTPFTSLNRELPDLRLQLFDQQVRFAYAAEARAAIAAQVRADRLERNSVGAPRGAEVFVPGWGPGRSFIHNVQTENYVGAGIDAAFVALDAALIPGLLRKSVSAAGRETATTAAQKLFASREAEASIVRYRSIYTSGPYSVGTWGRRGSFWLTSAAYRTGQVRTERIVHDAARRLGVPVRALVDEILYVPFADAPQFVVQNGRRIVILNWRAVHGADESLRLMKAAHEVGHAMVHASRATLGTMSYAAEEILVESQARTALAGILTRRALRNSIRYENQFRTRLGLPPLPVP
jgi:RHS repeat-associated protein